MKTFKDLEFKTHEVSIYFSSQAVIKFGNNYGVSVITGVGAYSSKKNPYELAVLYQDEFCYSTDITDNVIGHLTEEGVSEIMIKVQNLKE